MVTQTNHLLTARINELLTGIEQEEMIKSFQLLVDREEVLARSQVTIHWYSFVAVGIAMLFATLFWWISTEVNVTADNWRHLTSG